MTDIPASHLALLEQPNIGHLATLRPDGVIQLNDMWFLYDGDTVRFTHTKSRAKFRNLQLNPAMTFSVTDRENDYRYIELRGRLIEAIDDPTGAFYQELAKRYGTENPPPPADAADRVILVMEIDSIGAR